MSRTELREYMNIITEDELEKVDYNGHTIMYRTVNDYDVDGMIDNYEFYIPGNRESPEYDKMTISNIDPAKEQEFKEILKAWNEEELSKLQ